MTHEALYPCLHWIPRPRGRYTKAERRLHDEERERHGDDAEGEGRQHTGSREPITGRESKEHHAEDDTDRVVRDSAENAFEGHRRCCSDAHVPHCTVPHMADPASE